MNEGHTDSLVLVATMVWWPSAGTVATHPLDETRSFLAAVTDTAVPVNAPSSCSSTASASPSCGLSRLGTSIFMMAEWGDEAKRDTVVVRSPFSGGLLSMQVCLHTAVNSRHTTLHTLAEAGRIRIRPPTLEELPSVASNVGAAAVEDTAAERIFFARYYNTAWSSAVSYLRRCVNGEEGLDGNGYHSTCVSGDVGVGKRAFLRYLSRKLPPTVTLSSDDGSSSVTYVLEHRHLNLCDVLALDEREALETVRTVLRPPPVAQSSSGRAGDQANATSQTKPSSSVLLVVRLYNADLLWGASTNASVDVVSSQLCASLDMLRTVDVRSVAVMLWCTASQSSSMTSPLLARLAHTRVRVSRPSAEERVAFLQHQLQAAGISASNAHHHHLDTVSESCSALTMKQLSELTGERIELKLDQAAASEAASVEQSRSAYAGLFGIDEHIAALEDLVVWPITHLPALKLHNIPCARGVLVCGPTGCGKTALLRALCQRLKETRAVRVHVMMVDGLSLIEKEVGRSEKNIASLFETARSLAPTALFLDNLEALAPPRGRQSSETTTSSDRTLSALLTEMDGVGGDASRTVLVVASAASLECLDPAVRRPGRLDVHLTLHKPSFESAVEATVQQLGGFVRHMLHSAQQSTSDVGSITDDSIAILDASLARCARTLYEERTAAGTSTSAAEVVSIIREVMLCVVEGVERMSGAEKKASTDDGFCHALGELLESAFMKVRN